MNRRSREVARPGLGSIPEMRLVGSRPAVYSVTHSGASAPLLDARRRSADHPTRPVLGAGSSVGLGA
jgi:hypothetical protein